MRFPFLKFLPSNFWSFLTPKMAAAFLHSRIFQFVLLPAVIVYWFIQTDPSGGADTMMRAQLWGQALIITGVAYAIGKAMLGKASSETLYEKAIEGNTAAGIAYLGICLLRGSILGSLLVFFALVQK